MISCQENYRMQKRIKLNQTAMHLIEGHLFRLVVGRNGSIEIKSIPGCRLETRGQSRRPYEVRWGGVGGLQLSRS